MSLTTAQKTRLLRKFGDSDQTVFSDDELNDIWEEVAGASNDIRRYEAALYLMFEALLNSSTKLHDYRAGSTQESMSQVVDNLERRKTDYRPAFEAATQQRVDFARTTLRKRPNQLRRRPRTDRTRPTRYTSTLDDQDY